MFSVVPEFSCCGPKCSDWKQDGSKVKSVAWSSCSGGPVAQCWYTLSLMKSCSSSWLQLYFIKFFLTLFSRFWLLCCAPAPETWRRKQRPSLSRAARPAVVSRRFSVAVQSAGVSTLTVRRSRGLVPPVVDLDVRPAVRKRERWRWRWKQTWRLALKSTFRRAPRTETSCRCSVSGHAASVWTLREKPWLLGQQGALSAVRYHTDVKRADCHWDTSQLLITLQVVFQSLRKFRKVPKRAAGNISNDD